MSANITLSVLTHFSLSLLSHSLSAQLTLPEKLGAGAVWSQLTKVISEHQLASVQVSE